MLGAPRRFYDDPRLPRKRRAKKLPYRPPVFDENGKLVSVPAHFKEKTARQRPDLNRTPERRPDLERRPEISGIPERRPEISGIPERRPEISRTPENRLSPPPRYSERFGRAPTNYYRTSPRSAGIQNSHRDEPRMGTVYEKRDIFLNPIPTNVKEDDIKRALAIYNISTTRISVLERLQDKTRYAFVTPQSSDDFQYMRQLGILTINGTAIPMKPTRERNEEDEDSRLKARISTLLRRAGELGINLSEILQTPASMGTVRDEISRTSCRTFHAIKDDCEEVRLTRSLKVDPTTNIAQDSCNLKRDPMEDPAQDTVLQNDVSLSALSCYYRTPDRFSSNFPQSFETAMTSTPDLPDEKEEVPVPDSELGSTNSMLRSLHLERSMRIKRGAGASHCDMDHKVNGFGRDKNVSEDSSSYHTPRSSTTHSRVVSEELNPANKADNHVTPAATDVMTSLSDKVNGLTSLRNKYDVMTSPSNIADVMTSLRNKSDVMTSRSNTDHHGNFQNDLSGDSATSFPSFNFTPGMNTPPPSPRREENPPQSTISNLNRNKPPAGGKARKPDLPYEFRYLVDSVDELDSWFVKVENKDDGLEVRREKSSTVQGPDIPYNFKFLISDNGELDTWFDNKVNDKEDQQELRREDRTSEGRDSPMSVEETYELDNYPTLHSTSGPTVSVAFVDPEEFCRNPDVGQVQNHQNLETSLVLKEKVEILDIFRNDLMKIVQEKQFSEYDGIYLQVEQIFLNLVDLKLLSKSVINQNAGVVEAEIKSSEDNVTEVKELIEEMEGDEYPDYEMIQELKEENLKESIEALMEKKCDLLILQIANVIDHEIAISNASNPETTI